MLVTTITIGEMHAVHAVRAVWTALSGVPGVARAEVSLGRALVWHDGATTEAALREAVSLAGCTVGRVSTERRALPVL